jgi:hypothetical protein
MPAQIGNLSPAPHSPQLPDNRLVTQAPSRLWDHERSPKRSILGTRLRDSIEELKKSYEYAPQIIIVGDFNDEPFDESLAGHLRATRDRGLAMRKDSYFYNPFWRHLGQTLPYSPLVDSENPCGTVSYNRDDETRWRTFDQIIVSSSFLDCDRWYIDEEHTRILDHPALDDIIRRGSTIFDHRPILSFIRRRLGIQAKEVLDD